jgi:hypothetical protein
MADSQYRVKSISLNLRSAPLVKPSNRIEVLPQGKVVTKLAVASDSRWWEVSVDMTPSRLQGFVAHAYLEPAYQFAEPTAALGIAEVHLSENNRSSARDKKGAQAYPIGEAARPARQTKPRDAARIINWLRVDSSARYQRRSGNTYCNVYACDYCYLAGIYLPRVWWTQSALVDLVTGKAVKPYYGQTVHELNANSLFAWLKDYGTQFGWVRTYDLTDIQEAANAGGVAVICAQRADPTRPGHIAAVVPETGRLQAVRNGTVVTRPLQSQAGITNYRYGTGSKAWWVGQQFGAHGFWYNA